MYPLVSGSCLVLTFFVNLILAACFVGAFIRCLLARSPDGSQHCRRVTGWSKRKHLCDLGIFRIAHSSMWILCTLYVGRIKS
jgi:hypothetical protein